MSTLQSSESTAPESRQDAADTLSLAQSALKPSSVGIGQKLALAGTVYRLAKRYPIPVIVIGAIALAYYVSRRRGSAPQTLH